MKVALNSFLAVLLLLLCASRGSAQTKMQMPLPAAMTPALEARLGFSTLARVSSSNSRILFNGLNGSATMNSNDRFGGMLEMGYLRASNVFGTGHSNSILTYLCGPVFYPYRRGSMVTSLHVVGGGARVAGVVGLTPTGYTKGHVNNIAWAFGGGLEKWFSNSLALRVDVEGIHTTFYNPSLKLQGEYDLRATWGVIYYFGRRRKSSEFQSVAGKPLE
jgi:hypothetical protein